ncbi:unnamed protein product [Paramecium sonneborni]|uniref:Uncharacterized protein n=1 Tax=Paramecium sonneborni TaxID=65129 RepID=A0A8S1NXL0_9CILI|nr:unnamed protein product [Paramecium sonneborni]
MSIILFTLLTLLFDLAFEISITEYQTNPRFKNCLNVIKGNCEMCDQQYFLFQLPQDHNELGLKAGIRICVECPYIKFNEANNSYCGDCLDNSQTWDKSRRCTYDYKTKSTGISVFHKIARPVKQLFYVVKSGYQIFTTQSCDGCENFCKYQNQTCFQVSKQFSYDLNNLYISCSEGYEYSDILGGCDPCPDNCKSCQINKNIITDDSGKTIVTIKKNCMICNQGFSLLITRTKLNEIETNTQCIACFTGCDTCYFGKNQTNLNEKPWDDFNNHELLLTLNYEANQIKFYEDLFKLYFIAQRCEYCTSTTQSTFIPSLNRRSCVRCGTNCKRCEYQSGQTFPTRDKLRVVEPENSEPSIDDIKQIESQYFVRCRECDKFTQTFFAIGTGCTDCQITNCKLCGKVGDPSVGSQIKFSTLVPNFEPLDIEEKSLEKCMVCQDGYYLSDDQKQCNLQDSINKPNQGCLTYKKEALKQQCLLCDIGYTLYNNENSGSWECTMNCSSLINDYLCQSCISNGNNIRCLRCLEGYFVDMITGLCKKCSENGYCKKCYSLSLSSVHYSDYFDYKFDEDENILGPFCYECTPGDNNKGPFLNEDLRYCEKGGDNCEEFQPKGIKGYCNKCDKNKVGISLSSSIDGSDCIECPENTIGCRDRSQSEITLFNPFYDPTDTTFQKYSRLSFKCDGNNYYFDTKIARCISKNDFQESGDRSDEITINADCQQNQVDVKDQWKINAQYSDITAKDAFLILEDKLDSIVKTELFNDWNKKAVTKITIILNFQYYKDNSKCFFQKDTYFTTNIKKNVFSIKELELKIITNSHNQGERIQWFIQRNIYFTYFTSVSIRGFELYPANDLEDSLISSHIPKYEYPFGLLFKNNTGSKFNLENVKIGNLKAESHYKDKSQYTTPYSLKAIQNKMQKPFFTQLLNTYEIYFLDVEIYSQYYLLNSDITFQPKPFGLIYDSEITLPYLNIKLENVRFYDIAVENQAIFELQQVNFLTAPEWSSKILITQVQFYDCYFINNGAFLSTTIFNQPMGMIVINSLMLRNIEYNNSRGIVDFNTMQQIKVNNFQMYDSKINYTALFHITTIELSDVYLKNISFTNNGRLIQTKYELKTIRVGNPQFSGLKLFFINLEFDQIICLTPQCLLLITEIKNEYDIPINITMKGLIIKQINTTGFDEKIWEAATSASIRIEKSNTLVVSDFESIENADLAIFYVEQVWNTKFININCHQKIGLKIRNNYCLFINNAYQNVELLNIQLHNLIGRDNSFIGISSWSNLIYNTSTADYLETIIINGVQVIECKIITTVLAVPSSAILIDSTQMQIVQVNSLYFYNNHHIMNISGSLRPSNPTFLMRSVVGTLILKDSFWRSNFVQGYGAVLYLEVGTQIISNISMINSNFDIQTKTPFPLINQIAEGGHLYLSATYLDMNNCTFSNSTAKLGGGLFIRTLKEGIITINNISIQYAYTPLNGAISSKGGCLYIDSMASELDMKILNTHLKNCFTRGGGGAIFLVSYDKQQNFRIEDSLISNCYALNGLAIKTIFHSRTYQRQKMILQTLKLQGNQSNSLEYLLYLDNLQQIEKFLFLKRIAAIEQDYGQIEIQNAYSEGLVYYGYISIWQAKFIKLNTLVSQNSIISYRPYIEILEPLENPLEIDLVQFRNISSISINNLNCTSIINHGLCIVLQIRLEFPGFKINPALMIFDLIQETTRLQMKNIIIDGIICKECHGGLVQIMRVQNLKLIPLVVMSQCKCLNSESSYYGCFTISSESYFREQVMIDKTLGTTLTSNLTAEKIIQLTNLIQYQQGRILEQEIINQTQTQYNFNYTTPNPSYQSHVVVELLKISDVKAIHGGGISFYGLTVNLTQTHCAFAKVTGRGGCIYFESYPKNGGTIYHRINIANSQFLRNNASIGGAIAVIESGINNYSQTDIIFARNFAEKYGDNVAEYPIKLGVKINATLKQQNYHLIIKSGYEMNKFLNQQILIVYLDKNNQIMSYQQDQNCTLVINIDQNTKNQTSIIKKINKQFINEHKHGFDYSDSIIYIDPYKQMTIDGTFNSSHINIPIYHDQYPYQCIGFDTRYTLQIRISSIECQLGEFYEESQGICIPCANGTYALTLKANICKQKVFETMDYTYMNQIKIKKYYWRLNYKSDLIEKCVNKEINCKGGFEIKDDSCQKGYIGALCEECDLYAIHWESSYYNSAKYECQVCSGESIKIGLLVIISIITVFSTIQSVKAHDEIIQKIVIMRFQRHLKILFPLKSLNQTAILIKILYNFLQLLSIIEGFKISIPQGTLDTINTLGMPAKAMANALDCILPEQTHFFIQIDQIYLRIIWSLSFLLFCLIFEMVSFICFRFLKYKSLQRKTENESKSDQDQLKNKLEQITNIYNSRDQSDILKAMAFYFFLFLQPTFLIEFGNLIVYRNISEDSYVQANVSYMYNTYNHSQWLLWFAYPGFFILLFLPLIFIYKIKVGNHNKKLNKILYMKHWGYIYLDYIDEKGKKNQCYWEFFRLYIRSSICIIICCLAQNFIMMSSLSLICIFIYLVFSSYFQPYSNRKNNKIDKFSFFLLTITFSFSIVIYQSIQTNNQNYQIAIAGIIILYLLNTPFILYLILEIIKEAFQGLPSIIEKFKDKTEQNFLQLRVKKNCLNCWHCCNQDPGYLYRLNKKVKVRNVKKRAQDVWKDLQAIVYESIEEWKLDKSRQFKIKKWYHQSFKLQDERIDLLQEIE